MDFYAISLYYSSFVECTIKRTAFFEAFNRIGRKYHLQFNIFGPLLGIAFWLMLSILSRIRECIAVYLCGYPSQLYYWCQVCGGVDNYRYFIVCTRITGDGGVLLTILLRRKNFGGLSFLLFMWHFGWMHLFCFLFAFVWLQLVRWLPVTVWLFLCLFQIAF